MWAKLRGSATALYVLAGVLTWPVVTAVIYWGDRLTTNLPGLGEQEPTISLWAAGACAFVVSALIIIAGWLQSSHQS